MLMFYLLHNLWFVLTMSQQYPCSCRSVAVLTSKTFEDILVFVVLLVVLIGMERKLPFYDNSSAAAKKKKKEKKMAGDLFWIALTYNTCSHHSQLLNIVFELVFFFFFFF